MYKPFVKIITLCSSLFLFSCGESSVKINIEEDLSTAIEHSELSFFPNVKERFGKDVSGVNDIKINSNDEGITLMAEVSLENGKKEERTVLISNEELEGIVKKVSNGTNVDLNWTTDDNLDIDIDVFESDSSRKKIVKIKKTGQSGSVEDKDQLFVEEIENAVFLEHQEKVKSINTMNVSIENGITVIEADVILENGKQVKQVIERNSDDELSEENKVIKVKMIEIEKK